MKPSNKKELVNGIKVFWKEQVDIAKCQKFINHVINKASPAVVDSKDCATKF